MIVFRNHNPEKFSFGNQPGANVALEFLDPSLGAGFMRMDSFKVNDQELIGDLELTREGNVRMASVPGGRLRFEPVPETVVLSDDFSGPNRWQAMSVSGGAPELTLDAGKLRLQFQDSDMVVIGHELAVVGDGVTNPQGSVQISARFLEGSADFMAGIILTEPDLITNMTPRQIEMFMGQSGGVKIAAVNLGGQWDVQVRDFNYGEFNTFNFALDPETRELRVNFWGLERVITVPVDYVTIPWVPFLGAMIQGQSVMEFQWTMLETNITLPAGWKITFDPDEIFPAGERVYVEIRIAGGE